MGNRTDNECDQSYTSTMIEKFIWAYRFIRSSLCSVWISLRLSFRIGPGPT